MEFSQEDISNMSDADLELKAAASLEVVASLDNDLSRLGSLYDLVRKEGASRASMEALVEITGESLEDMPLSSFTIAPSKTNQAYALEELIEVIFRVLNILLVKFVQAILFIIEMTARGLRKLLEYKVRRDARKAAEEAKASYEKTKNSINDLFDRAAKSEATAKRTPPTREELGLTPRGPYKLDNIQTNFNRRMDKAMSEETPGYDSEYLIAVLNIYAAKLQDVLNVTNDYRIFMLQMFELDSPIGNELPELISNLKEYYYDSIFAIPFSELAIQTMYEEATDANFANGQCIADYVKGKAEVVPSETPDGDFWNHQWVYARGGQVAVPLTDFTIFNTKHYSDVLPDFKIFIPSVKDIMKDLDKMDEQIKAIESYERKNLADIKKLKKTFSAMLKDGEKLLAKRKKKWQVENYNPDSLAWPLEFGGARAGMNEVPTGTRGEYFKPDQFPTVMMGANSNLIGRMGLLLNILPKLVQDVTFPISRRRSFLGHCLDYYAVLAQDEKEYKAALDEWMNKQ